ncbi:uncharacterized protein FIBRA_04274 [Fibroporia radiculosa]|uniref:Nucleolar 27S pre-rRNA processing Urb2/Npa2 C-terminal domain-containing protein n=1 Tax=Fibroporia radiculosa TaxID=599839 RepID=J4H2V7_9APHY|nr:uncharacterized protein FIBRA_04274 [Fibroporia radiculosa]CCM02194.1 predicted protein [Fibroporia radiculosa]
MAASRCGSVQDFIRALKAPSDPPRLDSSLKIELAREAWEDATFHLPNKGEVIADWILTRLLKDKVKEGHANPLLDFRFWKLLADVLTSSKTVYVNAKFTPVTIKSWLLPILNRTPIAPIISGYFTMSHLVDHDTLPLTTLVSQCIVVLWPLAASKFSPEMLLECLGAVLAYLGKIHLDRLGHSQKAIGTVASLIASSYRTALSNSAAKKKLYAAFLQHHIFDWLQCIKPGVDSQQWHQSLASEIFVTGIETFFNLDILRALDDKKCDATFKETLLKLSVTSPSAVIDVFPSLYQSFMQSIKRYKGALFGQSSGRAVSTGNAIVQLQTAGMAFLSCLDEVITSASSTQHVLVWRTRVELLAIVHNENLYNADDEDATRTLRHIGELAIAALASPDDNHMPQVPLALEALSALTRVDYDIMSPSFSTIWSRIALIPDTHSTALPYLDLLLEYHMKTRTIPNFIYSWTDAFSVQYLRSSLEDPQHVYRLVASSPLFCFPYLDRLSKAIHGFVTPGQIKELADNMIQRLYSLFKEFRELDKKRTADDGRGPRKRRKKDLEVTPVIGGDSTPDLIAVTFSLSARAAVVVLSSLPMHSTSEEIREETRNSFREACTALVPRALKGASKAMSTDDRRSSWGWQMVATASLRVYHSLAVIRQLHLNLRCDQHVFRDLILASELDDVVPEYMLEIARVLLGEAADGVIEPELIFDGLLHHLELHLRCSVSWSGRTHDLTPAAGEPQAVLALFQLLLTRWLPLLESSASTNQILRLVKLMLEVDVRGPLLDGTTSSHRVLTVNTAFVSTLRNAELWELQRVRDAFVGQLNEYTAVLESVDLAELLIDPKAMVARVSQTELTRISSVFEFLLYAPDEYFSRNSRANFLRKALVSDVLLRRQDEILGERSMRSLVGVREFTRRMYTHLGTIDHPAAKTFCDYLTDSTPSASHYDGHEDELVTVTMKIIGMYMTSFLIHARAGYENTALEVVQSFSIYLSIPVQQRPPSHLIREKSILQFTSTLTSSHHLSQYALIPTSIKYYLILINEFSFNETFMSKLLELYERMVAVFSLEMNVLSRKAYSHPVADVLFRNHFLRAWSCTLDLGRWLSARTFDLPIFGHVLVGQLLERASSLSNDDDCLAVLDVVLAELQMADESHHYEELVRLDTRLSGACKTLLATHFSYLLDYVFEALSVTDDPRDQDAANLVHFSTLLLHSSPEGTAKLTQNFVTKFLHLCADQPEYLACPPLRREILKFMSRQFNDKTSKPASIRPADLSSLWSIIGFLLSESEDHAATTDPDVFHEIVSIISALIRLRRDLVVNTLPHLGFVLCQLTKCLRAIRPHLGAKQTKLVMNTLPSWISANKPLSAHESKALARLMTTLAVKTLVRTYETGDAQKAESLARPFSKHAAYVLTAYTEAVNDTLCHVAAPVRKELHSGLFALCEMLGEYNRDALMVSALDADGKTIMKALWKDYEKERYMGQG